MLVEIFSALLIYILNWLLTDYKVICWMKLFQLWLGPFQKEAAIAASQAQALAAEKATETVANVRNQLMDEVPPRAKFDIVLAAPTVLVPQSSKSDSALVFDFGKWLPTCCEIQSFEQQILLFVLFFFSYIFSVINGRNTSAFT